MTDKSKRILPIPGLTLLEDRVLRQIVVWSDEYKILNVSTKSKPRYIEPPTTKRCTKHFEIAHGHMLSLLNRLEKQGYVIKRRRLSAGLDGNGYDGSLHSEVLATQKAREDVAKYQ